MARLLEYYLSLVLLLFLGHFSAMSTALKAEWFPIPSTKTIQPRRSGHTAFSTGPSDPTYVFGGYIEKDPTKEEEPYFREVRNDLWKWNNIMQSWEEMKASGDIPGPRLVTASATMSGKAYIFGGWDPESMGTGGSILDSVHSLDLTSNLLVWKKLAPLPGGPASRHVALSLPNQSKILIHTHRCEDHVWLFDPERGEFTKQKTTGTSPGSVGLHAATMLDGERLVVFGGAVKDGTMTNRSYVLDTKTWEWREVDLGKVDNACPTPRAGSCLVTHISSEDKGNCVILFGGAESSENGLNPRGDVWALRVDPECQGYWTLLLDDNKSDSSSRPEPRNAATLSPIAPKNDESASNFLLTGGWAPFRRTWDDAFMLRINEE